MALDNFYDIIIDVRFTFYIRKHGKAIAINIHTKLFVFVAVVKQLCWEKELHDFHSSNDFCLVNGQWLFQFLNTWFTFCYFNIYIAN